MQNTKENQNTNCETHIANDGCWSTQLVETQREKMEKRKEMFRKKNVKNWL